MVEFSYCCSLSGGRAVLLRVSVNLSGSALRGRTTDRVTVEPGLSSSISRIAARDSSRVDWPPIDSMTSRRSVLLVSG